MKIALHPPPPPPPPPSSSSSYSSSSYLTLLPLCLPSRFIFEDYTPTNFDTFPAAVMTVFQVWLPQIPSFLHDTLHPGYISHPRRRLNNSAHSLSAPLPPLSSHTPRAHIRAHEYQTRENVNGIHTRYPMQKTRPRCEKSVLIRHAW